MGNITNLLSQFSIEAIILFIIAFGLSLKCIGELWDYFYAKIKKYFNYVSSKDKQHDEIINSIQSLHDNIEELKKQQKDNQITMEKVQDNLGLVNERLQETSRNYIIDKHHYYCYEIGTIDDLSLQSIEREYLHYKAGGGNSFIDNLMDELRNLPRFNIGQCSKITKGEK